MAGPAFSSLLYSCYDILPQPPLVFPQILYLYRVAQLEVYTFLVNNSRHFRAIAILSTNSETRIFRYFADLPNNKIAQQLAEIFKFKEKSWILTWGLTGAFSAYIS